MFAETGVDFHEPQLKGAFGFGDAVPCGHGRGARGQFGVGGNPAELFLAGKDFFTELVPALVELAFVFVGPLLGDVVRPMDAAGRPIHEERFVRRKGAMFLQPGNPLGGHVLGEVIFLIVRRLDRRGVFHKSRLPLRGFAREEAVEIIEAVARGPIGEWPHGGRLVGGRVVPFTKGGGLVAVVLQHLGNRRGSLRNDARVAVPIHRSLGDRAAADALVIASGEQSRTRGRTDRGGMKAIIADAFVAAAFESVGVWAKPPKVSGVPKPASSMSTMSTLGAPWQALGSTRRLWTDSCSVGPALLADGGVGNGRTEPSLGVAA